MIRRKQLSVLVGWAIMSVLNTSATWAGQRTDQATLERLSRQAEQALADKNLDGAAAALEKLSQLAPEVAEVHGNLGMVYYSQGRFILAARAFECALKLNPHMDNARLMLGICLAEIGRHKDAVTILEPAFRSPPDRKIARLIGLELQRAYTGLKQYDKAEAVSEDLINRYADDPEVLFHGSRLHAERALQLMTRLVQVAPQSIWVRESVAELHESKEHYDLAIVEYENVLKMDPRLPGVHFRLGRAMLLRSNDEKTKGEALKHFEQELAIDPQNSNAEYEIGEIYRQRGKMEEACKHFTRAIHDHPEFEDAQIALARSLIGLGKPREALSHLLAAIEVNPVNDVSHFQLATVYKTLGDTANYQEEMALFQRYHVRPSSSQAGGASELPYVLTTPHVTKQRLDSEPPKP